MQRDLWAAYAVERSTANRNALVEANLGIVRHVVKRMRARIPRCVASDDLLSAGYLGLIRSVERYDPNRGVSFSTFANFGVRGAILDELRSLDHMPTTMRRKLGDQCPGKVSIQSVPNEVGCLVDRNVDPPWTWMAADEFWARVNGVSGDRLTVLERCYRRGESQVAIGRSAGLCKARVWQILREAEGRLAESRHLLEAA